MKFFYLLIAHLIISTILHAQEIEGSAGISNKTIIQQAQRLLNDYMRTVKLSLECDGGKSDLKLATMLRKFADTAKIHVRNLKSKKAIPRKPLDYFNGLRNICLSGKYDEIKVDLFTVPITAQEIKALIAGKVYVVNHEFKQRIDLIINGKSSYCDITYKSIEVSVIGTAATSYTFRISGINIVKIEPCLQ